MKSLIKNYVSNLTKEKVDKFAKKHDVFLSDKELDYLLFFAKENIDNLLKNDKVYLEEIKNNISSDNYEKLFKLYTYYKSKYKGYLF